MLQLLSALRHKCAIGYVGGSDYTKQQEQLGTASIPVTALFDFCFAENGLTAYRLGQPLASQSFVGWLGEERYKQLVNFVLRYLADIECPVKRGTFVEFRYVRFRRRAVGEVTLGGEWKIEDLPKSRATNGKKIELNFIMHDIC